MITLPDKIRNDLSSSAYQLQYLLEIQTGLSTDPPILIGTTPVGLVLPDPDGIEFLTYYEDANMKVSNLKEKIDLKTKKIQYSDFTFTLSNLEGVDGNLIDKLDNIYGADINLYAITQSCDLVEDRLPIAKLKVTRMENDDTSIKITANDRNLEGFYVKLPKTLLEKDVNTYEEYNLKPVPILYGHLENAPAAVYYDETKEPRLLVDDSYDDNEKEIEGIKQYNILKQDNLSSDPVDEWQDEMISPNCVKVQLGGDSIVDVVCRPYVNARDEIIETHNYPQYETYHDYVQLYKKYGDINTLLDGVNALWCSHLSKATIDSQSSYEYHRFGSYWLSYTEEEPTPPSEFWGSTMSLASIFYDGVGVLGDSSDDDPIGYKYRSGIEQWSFGEVNGASVYTPEDTEEIVDVNFIGNVWMWSNLNPGYSEGELANTGNIRIFGHYSPYKHDYDQDLSQSYSWYVTSDATWFEYNLGDVQGSGYGSPEEYLSGALLGSDPDYDYVQYAGEIGVADSGYFWMMQRHAFYGEAELPQQYASYLTQGLHDPSDGSYWKAHYENLTGGLHKGMAAKTLTLYYMVENQSTESETPTTSIVITPTWTDLQIRKTWANENIFENIFYVNARGRVDTDLQLSNTYKIKAKIKVLTEEDMTTDDDQDRFTYEHKHHLELYKILTDVNFRTKVIDGEVYDLMMRFENLHGSHYIWDIDVNNIFFANDFNESDYVSVQLNSIMGFFLYSSFVTRTDHMGWVYDITAKAYTTENNNEIGVHAEEFGEDWSSSPILGLPGFKLVYGKINWGSQSEISSIDIASRENSTELDDFNIRNDAPMRKIEGDNNTVQLSSFYGLCGVLWMSEDMEENPHKLIDNGAEIIKNLVNTEMGIDVTLDEEKYMDSIYALGNSKMAFSINEQKKSQEILEDICSQSRLTFRYRPRDSFAIVGTIKNEYDRNNFDKELNIEDMLSYKYSKTKIEDLCIGGCSVKWGWDYEKGENISITREINLSEVFLSQYKLFYGIIEEDNYKLELEAPYISDKASATEFRDFMFNYYKNQHTTLKCSLTMQQGFELEAGDILKINSTEKVYGARLQDNKDIIDQQAYPLFYITSLTKYLDKVDMECVQLHNLSLEGIGDHIEETDIDPESDSGLGASIYTRDLPPAIEVNGDDFSGIN